MTDVADSVTLTIDGMSVTVPKGTNVLEAARTLGIDISAFCYHPGLPVVAQCRQCLVSVEKNP
ncbi:MAG TPA: 2Fe-2S iron-sulfur cluster-binding protein, partial [Kofleriaceae bacterium]